MSTYGDRYGACCQRAGTTFDNEATVLVGDTPNDVAAGLEVGVQVIGVATGKTSLEELRKAGATWVIETVDAVQGLVADIGQATNPLPEVSQSETCD